MAGKKKGGKKHRKDSKKGKQTENNTFLGTNVRTLGTAVVGAAVAELAQSALTKVLHSDDRPNVEGGTDADQFNAHSSNTGDSEPNGTQDTLAKGVSAVRDGIDKVPGTVQNAATTVKDTLADATPDPIKARLVSAIPAIRDAVEALKAVIDDVAPDAGEEIQGIVKQKTGDLKGSVANLAMVAADTVIQASKRTKGKKKAKKSR
jgi:hypothetical protein